MLCPEVEIGLGVPRKPIRLYKINKNFRIIQEETQLDLTEILKGFSYKFVNKVKSKVHGFILKAKSPSCGIANCKFYLNGKVYGRPYGIFVRIIKENLPNISMIDEIKLSLLRDKFLNKVFTVFEFKKLK